MSKIGSVATSFLVFEKLIVTRCAYVQTTLNHTKKAKRNEQVFSVWMFENTLNCVFL